MKRFPIQFGDGFTDIPWDLIASHEARAIRNHDQSLQRLAERGGLSPDEALAVIEDRPWHRMDPVTMTWPPACPVSSALLRKLVTDWENSHGEV